MSDPVGLVLRRTDRLAWMLLPSYIERVAAFHARHDVSGVGALAAVLDQLQADFGAGRGRYFALALLTEKLELCGHLLAGIEQRGLTGQSHAMVYQWQKDTRMPRALDDWCEAQVDEWAKACGAKLVTALVLSESRARLFARRGYKAGARVIYREVV